MIGSTAVVANARVTSGSLTGVQRYAQAMFSCWESESIELIAPSSPARGVFGHAWEQAVLPVRAGSRLLFSPGNTGPLAVSRQVVTIHDVASLDHPERLSGRFSAWYRFLTPILARKVARIITISEFSKERLLTHVPMDERRVVVIPNGVAQTFTAKDAVAVASMRNELRLPQGRYVLCVGTLEPRKNISRLLQAWSLIVGHVPKDVSLILAGKSGSPEMFGRLAGLDALPPRVHLTGHVADEVLPALYSGALVFAFPSLYEGFGLPPLEAMACGVPVLTGNLSALPEVVGGAGVMVDPTSVEAIADGLVSLIEGEALRERFIRKGLIRAAQFSWDLAAQQTWEVLQEVRES